MASRNNFVLFRGRRQGFLSTWMLILFLAVGTAVCTVGQQSSTPELRPSSTVAVTSEPLIFFDTSQVVASTHTEGKYDRVLPTSAVTIPTKLSTNQHAPAMAVLHPSSALLAVLSVKHFSPSYLSSDWPDPARVASLQPMTAVVSQPFSNLHEKLGLGSVSKLILHDTTEQLSALQTALNSSFQTDFQVKTLKPGHHPITARLPFSPQNYPISAAVSNLHLSNQPITTQTELHTYSALHTNTSTIINTLLHEYSTSVYINNIINREEETAPANKSLTYDPSRPFTSGITPDFSSQIALVTDTCMEDNSKLTSVNISSLSSTTFDLFPNQFSTSVSTFLVAEILISFTNMFPQCSFSFSFFTNHQTGFNLTNISSACASPTRPYSNHSDGCEVCITLVCSTITLLMDQLQQRVPLAGENGSVLGNSISSLQSIPAGKVMMMTLGPSLAIIAASMTNPDHSQSISVSNMTPAPLQVEPTSQGSCSCKLSSATTLLLILLLDLSTPTSMVHSTAAMSGQMQPSPLDSSPSCLPSFRMKTDPEPLELRSYLHTDSLSNSNLGHVMTQFPVLMSSLEKSVSFGVTLGYSSLPHLESSPSLKLLTVVGSADKTVPLLYELGLEANLLAGSVQSLFCIADQGVSSPPDSSQTLSHNPSKMSWSSLGSATVQAITNPTPDTNLITKTRSLHFSTQSQQIIISHLPVRIHKTLLLAKSGGRHGLDVSLTSGTFTAPSFLTAFACPTIPSKVSRSGRWRLLFKSLDPIQTFRHPISLPSALSFFNQSPWYYLPGTISMATAVSDVWEIFTSVSSVSSNYKSLTDANDLFNGAKKEIEISDCKQNNISSIFARDNSFCLFLLVCFSLLEVYFLTSVISPEISSTFSFKLFPSPMPFSFLPFLSLLILSLLPLALGSSSLHSKVFSLTSVTPSPMAPNSSHASSSYYSYHSPTPAHPPSLPSHSLLSNPSTSGYPLPLETYSFHASISSLLNSSMNNPPRSQGLPQITSVIATPSLQYPAGNSRPLTMSAYASISPVSARLVSGATETSPNSPMLDSPLLSLNALPMESLSSGSPALLVHETASLHLASASPDLRSSQDAEYDLSQMEFISLSQSLTLLSTVAPTSPPYPFSASLHASFNSDFSVKKQASSGLVTPSISASSKIVFLSSYLHVESPFTLSMLTSAMLTTVLHTNSAHVKQVASSAPVIPQPALSAIFMPSPSSDAHFPSASTSISPSSSFHHKSEESITASRIIHPPSLASNELSSIIASSKFNMHASPLVASSPLPSNISPSLTLLSSSMSSLASHALIVNSEDLLSPSSFNQMLLISSMPPLFTLSSKSHQLHSSLTTFPDRITPVTSSPFSFLLSVGPVATPSSSLMSASIPSPSPSFQTESNVALTTSMLTPVSASMRSNSFYYTTQVFSSVMNSPSASEVLFSMASSTPAVMSKLGVGSSVVSVDASALLETLLLTQTSFEFVTLSDSGNTNQESREINLTSTDLQSLDIITQPTTMFYTSFTPSFVTPIAQTSSIVPQVPSLSTLTQAEHLTSVYKSDTLISTPYSVDYVTISSMLTQFSDVSNYESVIPLSSNSNVLDSIELESAYLEGPTFTASPMIQTQTPYTTSNPINESLSPTKIFTQLTPPSQILIQTPTPPLSSIASQSSTLLSSSILQSMPVISPSASVSDAASMQMTITSSILGSSLLLPSMIMDDESMSYGVTIITSMPFDVSVDKTSSSFSVSMSDGSVFHSVDNLSSTDGNLTSTTMPSPTATSSQVQLQTSAPSLSFLSPVASTELLNTNTEFIGTLHSSLLLETMSTIAHMPILSSSVQSAMSSVQTNGSMPSSSQTFKSSSLQEVLSSTYAIMLSDVVSQRDSLMQTMTSTLVNVPGESTIMPSSSMHLPTRSLILNSTSSLMDSLSKSLVNRTEAMPVQSSTPIVDSEFTSRTIMSSIAAMPKSSAGQTIMASSVIAEPSTSFVDQQNASLSPTLSSSEFDSMSSAVVPMTTKIPSLSSSSPSSSSSQMIFPTPNISNSSDFSGMSSTMPTPSLPIMPSVSSSSLLPNSTFHAGAPATSHSSSTTLVTSPLPSPSLSLAPTSLMETHIMNSTSSSTPTVSVEILSTPLTSPSTLSPSLSVSVSTVFVPTSPTTPVNLSTIDATPVVVSMATTSFPTELPTSAVTTSQASFPTSTPAAENATTSPSSTDAVVSQETSSSTPRMSTSTSSNDTMTSTPASDVTSSMSPPGLTAVPSTTTTTPMVTTEATTPDTTTSPTTSSATTTTATTSPPPVVTTSQEVTSASTVARTTQTMTPTPFDTSFATKPYWLSMGLGVDENVDIKAPSYVQEMEGNLARMYVEANRRSNQRMVEVEALLEQLDPEKNPAVGLTGRRRRAVTVDTITAQIIDLTRQEGNPTDVELTFYIVEEGAKLLSSDAKMVLDELTLQEMTLYLEEPVNSPPIEVVPSTTVMPSAEPPARLWIIAAVLVPLALLFCCCLCCCCCCCGRKPRKEDGPMDPDTFKMLQFKAKYPYRQYPATPQDQQLQPVPRGFDVVKQDYANNAFGMEAGTMERKQRIEEEAEMMIQRELPRRTMEGHVSPVLHSARQHYPVTQSPTPSGSSSSSLVPPLPAKQTKGHQRSRDASTSGSDTGEELYKQRREYMAAQEEISRVLEPELYSSQGRKSQKGKAGGKKGGVQKMKERKTEGEKSVKNKLKKMESLPDNHYARAGVGAQDEADNKPEPLQETKQKMHALIDEAFSLVGKTSPSKNAVVPLSGGLSPSQNYSSREEGKKTPRDSSQQEVPRQLFAPVVPPIPRRKPKESLIDGGTQTSEMGQTTRVVVVPVTKPPQEGSSIIWSPYTAGDETARLSPSQEPASLPGGLNPSPIPSPRGVLSNHQHGLTSSRERRPDGDSLRGTKQGVVERYADMLQDMLTSQLPLPPEEFNDTPSKGANKQSVALLEGEPDYDWSFDRSINGSQRLGSKKRSPLPNRTKSNRTEKDSASTTASTDEKLPSRSTKENGVGKAVDKFYDELDVSGNLKYPTGQFSPQVANAVREELIRLTRRMGDGEESGLV